MSASIRSIGAVCVSVRTASARLTLVVMATSALVGCSSIGKSTKDNPDYLRQHHAAAVEFDSTLDPRALFDKLAADTSKCYAKDGGGVIMPVAGTYLFIPVKAPAHQTEAKFDDATESATIRVFSDGTLYLSLFQIDISRKNSGAQAVLYYADDNRVQRRIPDDVRAWLDGDDAACTFH